MTAPGNHVEVEGLRLHYTEAGEGEPVLLLHGWPTSAYLWRNVMPAIAKHNRVIALDLPGFGHSDKPTDASYSFRFFDRALEGFLNAREIERTALAVHDLGGPIGIYWASEHPERLTRLALLNTLVYARPSLAVVAFVIAARTPGVRSWLTSPGGLRFAMRLGVHDKDGLSEETIAVYQEPFASDEAREALRKTAFGLHPGGFKQLSGWLKTIDVPVRIVYGENDRILPDVARTMRKVVADVPSPVEVTALPGCGHFCQEDEPERIGALLSEFFTAGA